MPNRRTLEEISREEATASIVVERTPSEAVVETLLPVAPDMVAAVDETALTPAARGRSPSEIIWMKLRRNRTAMLGLYILIALYLAAVLAGFIAPYKYDDADHDLGNPILHGVRVLMIGGRIWTRPAREAVKA